MCLPIRVTPGDVVWARAKSCAWGAGAVMERDLASNFGLDVANGAGCVLVSFFGTSGLGAWIPQRPDTLQHFANSYLERSRFSGPRSKVQVWAQEVAMAAAALLDRPRINAKAIALLEQKAGSAACRSRIFPIGTLVRKQFGELWYCGYVDNYNSKTTWYHVTYEDGDGEHLAAEDVCALLFTVGAPTKPPASGYRANLELETRGPDVMREEWGQSACSSGRTIDSSELEGVRVSLDLNDTAHSGEESPCSTSPRRHAKGIDADVGGGDRDFCQEGDLLHRPGSSTPCTKVHPSILAADAAVHSWAWAAVAELLDNAQEAGAPHCNVALTTTSLEREAAAVDGALDQEDSTDSQMFPVMQITDDGPGIRANILFSCLSYRQCSEAGEVDTEDVTKRPNGGLRRGAMRLGRDCMVMTRTVSSTSIAFLSRSFLSEIQAEDVLVPALHWSAHGSPQFHRTSIRARHLVPLPLLSPGSGASSNGCGCVHRSLHRTRLHRWP
ncbi:hypothetical protein CYMTET_45819 [Cymbomonas tetramitiformis]|uniref:PTM/DIR17-like Tudor domain-containing protein n=1 Tax=Cymbomonas tetramitiformis TaxID=36881 RepID=A0AAE0BZG7_9CHLO|nr:hypothetical protein CYMTET_45819 [Cymbomonas tetramitiformis]